MPSSSSSSSSDYDQSGRNPSVRFGTLESVGEEGVEGEMRSTDGGRGSDGGRDGERNGTDGDAAADRTSFRENGFDREGEREVEGGGIKREEVEGRGVEVVEERGVEIGGAERREVGEVVEERGVENGSNSEQFSNAGVGASKDSPPEGSKVMGDDVSQGSKVTEAPSSGSLESFIVSREDVFEEESSQQHAMPLSARQDHTPSQTHLPAQRSFSSDAVPPRTPTPRGAKTRSSLPQMEGRRPPGSPWYDGPSPEGRGWDEEPVYEIWVSSASAHHSVATVIDYNGKFVNLDVSFLFFGSIALHIACPLPPSLPPLPPSSCPPSLLPPSLPLHRTLSWVTPPYYPCARYGTRCGWGSR